jgi:hypothetical protein
MTLGGWLYLVLVALGIVGLGLGALFVVLHGSGVP